MRNRLDEQIGKMKRMMLIEATSDIDFEKITKIIIEKLEGGYYHQDMLRDGRVNNPLYNTSGETMFGIDRKNGVEISASPEGREFWRIIDNADASNKWAWNYKGGNLQNQLTSLVARMMKPFYDRYTSAYLDPKSQEIINKNDGLIFNFVYATWNGPGWFKQFADKFDADVASGITDNEQLLKNVIRYRLESGDQIIVNTGKNINERIFGNLDVNFKLNGGLSSTSGSEDGSTDAYDFNKVDLPNVYDLRQKI
jgi:hypothetical protein